MAELEDVVTNEDILNIANAIRSVTRSTGRMTIPQMPERLLDIRVVETTEVEADFSTGTPVDLGTFDNTIKHLFIVTPKSTADAELLASAEPELQLSYNTTTGKLSLSYTTQVEDTVDLIVADLLLPETDSTKGFLVNAATGNGDSYTKEEADAKFATIASLEVVEGNVETLSTGLQEAEQAIQELETDLATETTARQQADNNLQNQIDAITSASDVVDVVGTYAQLQAYDTSHLKNNDIVKVLVDESRQNAIGYYRWVITSGVGAWSYIGSQGPFYTKSEADTLLQAKQDNLVSGQNIKTVEGQSLLGSGDLSIASKAEITLTGESGTLTTEQMALILNNNKNVVLVNDGERFYFIHDAVSYRTYSNINTPTTTEVTYKSIYVNTTPQAVNYGSWTLEEVTPESGGIPIRDLGEEE